MAKTSLENVRRRNQQLRPSQWLAEKARRRASPQKMERYREYHRQYRRRMTPRQKLMVEGYWKKYRRYGRWVKTDGKKHPGIKALRAQAMELSKKHGPLFELDHIIPLSSGGKHEPLNLQIIPRAVNREKSGGAFWLSSEYKDFRDVPEFLWPEHLKPHYQLMLQIFGHPLKKYAEAA